MAVISVLLALLVPAVQNARLSAQQMTCLNRLRQIEIAAQNHQSKTGFFPTESWHRQLRNHLEISNEARKVTAFTCPVDAEAQGTGPLYSFAINDGLGDSESLRNGFTRVGGTQKGARPSDVIDGLSNSVMFAEKLSYPAIAGQQTIAWEELPKLVRRAYRVVETNSDDPDIVRKACRAESEFYERLWVFDAVYTHLMAPNESSCVNAGTSNIIRGRVAASLHSGGTHIGLADGSARFTSSQVDIRVWRAIGSINGGEVTGEF